MFRTLFMAPSSNDGRPPSPTETNADGDGGVGDAGVEADALTAAAPKEHLVLVGDSGTGKSTLLSTIIGRPGAFHSGISAGTGLTAYLQTVEVDGRLYSDTPGLNDPAKKQDAADGIAEAIRLGGDVKILFVLTFESARVRQSSLDTMDMVLAALVRKDIQVDSRFSVVVNKMTSAEMKAWYDLEFGGPALLREYLSSARVVDLMLYVPLVDAIKDTQDAVLPAEQETRLAKLVRKMQSTSVPNGTQISVEDDDLPAQVVSLREDLKQREDVVKALERLTEAYEKNLAEAQAQGQAAATAVDALKAQFEDEKALLTNRHDRRRRLGKALQLCVRVVSGLPFLSLFLASGETENDLL
ncbi:hypothetical protein I4F81_004758 [Pyropia yezoensis]|uniref:Uncharacterized protein n=1 Tax=Pyropia yezoensis TaxID=2788 RepID=A0ACC3BX45_PYRYE|nr:hypothetical protein I4F81_004758 [Neopyropia yezoensis]